MSEPIIEHREEFNVTDIARKYAERVARVIDEQTLANVENQLAEFGYVKVVRCRDCACLVENDTFYDCNHFNCHLYWNEGQDPDGFCAWGSRRDA